jgi:hypothetical protein
MPAIHLVERKNNVRRVPDSQGEWESRYWAIAPDTAQRLIGGDLYLHSGQNEPSHFGGKIVSFRVHQDATQPEIDGRVIFRIAASSDYKGVITGREGWGNEKKLVW